MSIDGFRADSVFHPKWDERSITPAPKPEARSPKKQTRPNLLSEKQRAKREKNGERFITSTIAKSSLLDPHFRTRKSIKKENSAKRERRRKANADYYKSAEWREKRKLTFERDGYQCVERVALPQQFFRVQPFDGGDSYRVPVTVTDRCPNRGEIVNGKQTGRGLVCEEKSYGHRGVKGRIDTCVTRCKAHDRALTPLERANHAQGFRR